MIGRPASISERTTRGGPAGGVIARLRGRVEARPVVTRWLLAGPVTILAALATMAAMPLWVPPGAAGVNDIALPILLTPLIWAVPFFYACLAENLPRAALVLVGATVAQTLAVIISLA
ncbi:hypothetical protein [uncultured Amaricoccus sp.]|uniref:hypothetical protein n=1 Tax=uncultured Amaricoccus sp. TaxID=339341 RepID=UPI0026322687|nr:hypothetical protein [uncultured Amaricoccus sp.]